MTPIALTERYGAAWTPGGKLRTVFVNPDRIERYFEDDDGRVCVVFDRDHSIVVTEGLAEIARQLRYARRGAAIDFAECQIGGAA